MALFCGMCATNVPFQQKSVKLDNLRVLFRLGWSHNINNKHLHFPSCDTWNFRMFYHLHTKDGLGHRPCMCLHCKGL